MTPSTMSDEAMEIIGLSDKIAEQVRLTTDNIQQQKIKRLVTKEVIFHDILVFLFSHILLFRICFNRISIMEYSNLESLKNILVFSLFYLFLVIVTTSCQASWAQAEIWKLRKCSISLWIKEQGSEKLFDLQVNVAEFWSGILSSFLRLVLLSSCLIVGGGGFTRLFSFWSLFGCCIEILSFWRTISSDTCIILLYGFYCPLPVYYLYPLMYSFGIVALCHVSQYFDT